MPPISENLAGSLVCQRSASQKYGPHASEFRSGKLPFVAGKNEDTLLGCFDVKNRRNQENLLCSLSVLSCGAQRCASCIPYQKTWRVLSCVPAFHYPAVCSARERILQVRRGKLPCAA